MELKIRLAIVYMFLITACVLAALWSAREPGRNPWDRAVAQEAVRQEAQEEVPKRGKVLAKTYDWQASADCELDGHKRGTDAHSKCMELAPLRSPYR